MSPNTSIRFFDRTGPTILIGNILHFISVSHINTRESKLYKVIQISQLFKNQRNFLNNGICYQSTRLRIIAYYRNLHRGCILLQNCNYGMSRRHGSTKFIGYFLVPECLVEIFALSNRSILPLNKAKNTIRIYWY